MLTPPAPYRNNMLWEQSRGDSWSWSEMYHVLNVLKWRSNWSMIMISWLDIRWSSHHITTRDWRHHHYQMRPGGPQVTTEASLYFYIIPPGSQCNKSISIPWVEQSVSPKGSSATEGISITKYYLQANVESRADPGPGQDYKWLNGSVWTVCGALLLCV